MSQPQWELVYATDYSALYRDATGVYPPELAIAQTDDDVDEEDIEATVAYVYRFPLERHVYVDGVLYEHHGSAENPPMSTTRPWFADSLGSIADSVGSTVGDLVSALCSDDPATLACAYEAIGGYHGFVNFDEYPEQWTATEFAQWPDRGPRLKTDERDAFTRGYIECALWAGVMVYQHDDECPCSDPDTHTCEECGDEIHEDASPGVWLHDDTEDREGTDIDAEHVARPDTCTCAPELISSSDEHDESELDEDALKQVTEDAYAFYAENVLDLRASTLDMERAGHDFYLTRNRHGAGFWDEGCRATPEANAALVRLTEASHAYGSQNFEVQPDGKITVQ